MHNLCQYLEGKTTTNNPLFLCMCNVFLLLLSSITTFSSALQCFTCISHSVLHISLTVSHLSIYPTVSCPSRLQCVTNTVSPVSPRSPTVCQSYFLKWYFSNLQCLAHLIYNISPISLTLLLITFMQCCSLLSSGHTALMQYVMPFIAWFEYPPKWYTGSAIWLLPGWCHVKLLSSWCTFRVHHITMHQFTVSPHSKPHMQGAGVFSSILPPALLAE